MQGGKKPTRATAMKAELLEELLSQPNTYQKSQPPSWLLHHHCQLLLGEQSTENLPFWKHMLSNRTGKNPDCISFM